MSEALREGSYLAVDIGGTKTCAAVVGADGTVRHRRVEPTLADQGPEAIIAQTVAMLRQVRATELAEGGSPLALGVASAGIIDPATGAVAGATDHLHEWAGTPLGPRLSTALDLPTVVLNDVHAHGLGEALVGAGSGHRTVLTIAVGTGIGGAVVTDGSLAVGAHGAAGHLGHVPSAEAAGLPCACGRSGHVEAIASGPGLCSLYRRQGGSAASAAAVCAAADAGDDTARECVRIVGLALGRALGGWINTIDPDVVVLTGGLTQAGPAWWDAVASGVDQERIDLLRNCPIVPAAAGQDAALVGAARHAAALVDGAVQPSRTRETP